MIDRWYILSQALWIIGLALLLATLSFRSLGSATQPPSAQLLSVPFFNRLGLLLVAAGLTASSGRWLERVVWGVILCSMLFESARWVWQVWVLTRRTAIDDQRMLLDDHAP